MEKIISPENIRQFAYINDKIFKTPIKGIVMEFFGLGSQNIYDEELDMGKFFAEHNLLYVIPYSNPWAWMNSKNISFIDEVIDTLIEKYDLRDDIPIVHIGGSMGGHASIMYTRYSKRKPVACLANCPVCDLELHFGERFDLPRTLYSAFYEDGKDFYEELRKNSPTHIAEMLPDIPYYIFHCCEDKAVNKEIHSEVFVKKLKLTHAVTYHEVPGKGHCDLTEQMWEVYKNYVVEAVKK